MPIIAVFGGTGYLASLIKNQNNNKKNKFVFFSRKKFDKNYINYLSLKKNPNLFRKFDFAIHLAGPNQDQLAKNKNLIKKKNKITANICDLCIAHNIKLIYVSSMQIYTDYGKKNINVNSNINLKNQYSKSHFESEKIIQEKFINHKRMFIILRMGNVFGFKKYENLREIKNNLIHNLINLALKKKEILIKNASIQRSFIPSQIFIDLVNYIINKSIFNNSIINIFYKSFSLKEVAEIIQKRSKLLFKLKINIILKKFSYKKKFLVNPNQILKISANNKKINIEIDRILNLLKKNSRDNE